MQTHAHRSAASRTACPRPFAAPQHVVARRIGARSPTTQRAGVRAQYRKEYPDPEFIEQVAQAFPDQGIANVEEARALYSDLGYTYLDVRPTLEVEEVGKVRNSVNIPIVNSRKVFDRKTMKTSFVKEPNNSFIAMVEKKFPDKDNAKILVGCSDGRTYSIDALEALSEAGYWQLAGLKGGYYAWFKVFDNKLNRRRSGEYCENPYGDGADSCGIHASGAGFERVDAQDKWVPRQY